MLGGVIINNTGIFFPKVKLLKSALGVPKRFSLMDDY